MNKKAEPLKGKDLLNYYLHGSYGAVPMALGGAGVGSIIAALHAIRTNVAKHKERDRANDPDEDTIVITLPGKSAEVKASKGECSESKTKEETKIREAESNEYHQPRDSVTMRFGSKTAQDKPSATQATIKALLALGSVYGGYRLSSGIYDKLLQRRLKKELEEVQEGYLDQTYGNIPEFNKYSGFVDRLYDSKGLRDRLEKQAQRKPVPKADLFASIGATPLIMMALALGGTSYLTKRIADAQLAAAEKEEYNPPRPKRIVVKTLRPKPLLAAKQVEEPLISDTDEEEEDDIWKVAKDNNISEGEINQIKAAFWVVYDVVSGKNNLSKSAGLTKDLKKYNTSIEKIAEVLDSDEGELLSDAFNKVLPEEIAEKIANEGMYSYFFKRAQFPGTIGDWVDKGIGVIRDVKNKVVEVGEDLAFKGLANQYGLKGDFAENILNGMRRDKPPRMGWSDYAQSIQDQLKGGISNISPFAKQNPSLVSALASDPYALRKLIGDNFTKKHPSANKIPGVGRTVSHFGANLLGVHDSRNVLNREAQELKQASSMYKSASLIGPAILASSLVTHIKPRTVKAPLDYNKLQNRLDKKLKAIEIVPEGEEAESLLDDNRRRAILQTVRSVLEEDIRRRSS